MNETLWERKTNQNKVNLWLDNFQDEKEKLHALYLLTQFIYFNQFLIKSLLKAVYRDLFKYRQVEKIRKAHDDTLDADLINFKFQEILEKTRFIILGNGAESSAHLMYLFRTENNLPKDLFMNENQIGTCKDEIKHFIFIDDICGSGSQGVEYSEEIIPFIKEKFPHSICSFFLLVSTRIGKDKIKDESLFDNVDSVLELDKSYKSFIEKSRIFQSKDDLIDQKYAADFCGLYGKHLMSSILKKQHPEISEQDLESGSEDLKYGFSDGQLLLGFNHNTPDNTLPVIWYNEKETIWNPIFKRHNKIY